MTNNEPPLFTRNISHLPALAGLTAGLVGILVLVGWSLDISLFKSLHANLVSIKPNEAVAFILSGISLLLLGKRKNRTEDSIIYHLIPILAIIVSGIGFLTILEYLLHWNLGIDQLLFRERANAVETFVPGRMSPLAAAGFLIIGIAQILAYRFRHWSSQFLSLFVMLLGISTLFGYGFQVEGIYSPGPYTSVAFHSAVTLFIIGAGIIAIFPNRSIIQTVVRDDVGGFVARRLLPTALIIPLFLGLIILAGQHMGFYTSNVTTLLITISTVITFIIVIFSNARLLSLIEYDRQETERLRRAEVEEAQQRLHFLARASRILSRSLELETTFKSIARLAVPFLSDWCAIYLVQDNGAINRVAVKYTDGSHDDIMKALEEKYPTDPITSQGVFQVISSGNSQIIAKIPDAQFRESAQNEEHLQLIRGLGLKSVVIAPLKGHETVFGAITFAAAESGRTFSKADLELAEEIGRRAAVAIENAQLFQETKLQNEKLEQRVRLRTNELEVANLELRTEIVERRRIESELRESEETLEALVRTASKLIKLLDVGKVYEVICEETARVLNVPICNIRLFDSRKSQLAFTSGFGLPDSFWDRLIDSPDQYDRFLASGRENKPRITLDVQTLSDSPNINLFKEFDIRTTVGVSLMREDELIGRLSIATFKESRKFTEFELALLKGLADQAALAIQNAQLLDQVQKGRERLRRLSRQLVSVQEKERRRISKELHDEAGQTLTAMKINLSLLSHLVPENLPTMKEQLDDLSQLADELMERLRMLAHDLRPPALETLGLNKTLQGLCRQFAARTHLNISYEGTESESIPDETMIAIYRLVQEALTNVAKHADADTIQVKLQEQNSALILSIKDNGRGFQTGELDMQRASIDGMGLGSMQERLEFIGGRMEIFSKPGQGTEIIATVGL